MRDAVYDYDQALYGRSFLNCFERQCLVMLAAHEPKRSHWLLRRAFISSDAILAQIIQEQRPRYDFDSGLLSPDDLSLIGLTLVEAKADTYEEALPLIRDVVAERGYAFPRVDMFGLPNAEAFRCRHVSHSLIVTSYREDARSWNVIDDNPAGVLCEAAYPEGVLRQAYDVNAVRGVRYLTPLANPEPETAAAETVRIRFRSELSSFHDSRTLFTDLSAILATPWLSVNRAYELLHDAFAIHQGARIAFRSFLTREWDVDTSDLDEIVERSTELRNTFLIAQVRGSLDVAAVAARGAALADVESRLHAALLAADPL